jgi:hypothetical protein
MPPATSRSPNPETPPVGSNRPTRRFEREQPKRHSGDCDGGPAAVGRARPGESQLPCNSLPCDPRHYESTYFGATNASGSSHPLAATTSTLLRVTALRS